MAVVHFGSVTKTVSGRWFSAGTLCGSHDYCGNRDPAATTCKRCLNSNAWENAVSKVEQAAMDEQV